MYKYYYPLPTYIILFCIVQIIKFYLLIVNLKYADS